MILGRVRLAERQGLLSGDLNAVQRAALLDLLLRERDELKESERRRLFQMMYAMHPDKIEEIQRMASTEPDEGELMEEEDLGPFSLAEMDQMAADFKRMGFSMS